MAKQNIVNQVASKTQNTSPHFFQEVSDAVPAMVAVYNIRTGEYLYVNKAIKKLLGYSPKDFTENGLQFVSSLVHPEDVSRILEENNKALKAANSPAVAGSRSLRDKKHSSDKDPIINFEYRMRHKNGSYRWLHTDGSVFSRGSGGKVECVLNSSLDITYRKEAEQRLEKLSKNLDLRVKTKTRELLQMQKSIQISEKRYRTMIEQSPLSTQILTPSGKTLMVNKAWEKLWGAKLEHLKDYNMLKDKQLITLGIMPYVKKGFKGEPTLIPAVRYEPNKTVPGATNVLYRWVRAIIYPVKNEHGTIQEVVLVHEDITQQKDAAEKVQQSGQQLQAIIDGSPAVIFVKDTKGRYLLINRQYETLFKITREKVKGKTDYDLFPKKTAEQVRKNDKKVFASGSPLEVEEIVPHADGFHTYISVKFPLFDISGKPYAICGIATDITERKQTEEKLRQSEVLFRTLTTHAPVGIYLTDRNGDCQFVNDKWQAVAGMSLDEARGQGWIKALHPEDKKRVFDEWYTAAKNKKPFESEYRFKTPAGKVTWLHGGAMPLQNEEGETTGYIGTIVDLSDRKLLEANLKYLAEVGKLLSLSLDYDTTLTTISKLAVPYLADWCTVQVVGTSGNILRLRTEFINPAKAKLARELEEKYRSMPLTEHSLNFQSVLKTGKSKLVSTISKEWFQQISKDKARRELIKKLNPSSHMLVPLKIHSKKIIGVISLARLSNSPSFNKTDLILAEELAHRAAVALDNARLYREAQQEIAERKRTEVKLKESQDNLLFLAEASKILSSSLDYKTTLTNIAKAAVPNIADWCAVDILNGNGGLEQVAVAHKDPKKVKWAKELRKADPPDMNAQTGIPNVLRTGKSEFYQLITDELLVKVARNKKHLKLLRRLGFTSAIVVPLNREGKCIGGITFVTAETKRQYTEADLAMAEELATRASLALENAGLYKTSQEAVALRDNFISVASHELKTPITSVKIFTQVLQKHSEQIGDEEAKKNLARMDKQLNKLIELIYNLLNISKIQAGRMEFNQKLFDFDTCVREIVEILQEGATKHKLIIDGKTNKKIYGDEDRIGQVVSNLVANAIKYSPKADKIFIRLSADRENVIVCVEDFGIGLAKEHLEKIFERFYRVFDTTDKTFPGLGIGLYISSEIINRHHGKVWVESNTGKGSKFYFSLPLDRKKKPNGIKVL